MGLVGKDTRLEAMCVISECRREGCERYIESPGRLVGCERKRH